MLQTLSDVAAVSWDYFRRTYLRRGWVLFSGMIAIYQLAFEFNLWSLLPFDLELPALSLPAIVTIGVAAIVTAPLMEEWRQVTSRASTVTWRILQPTSTSPARVTFESEEYHQPIDLRVRLSSKPREGVVAYLRQTTRQWVVQGDRGGPRVEESRWDVPDGDIRVRGRWIRIRYGNVPFGKAVKLVLEVDTGRLVKVDRLRLT